MSMNFGGGIEELLSPLKQRMELLEDENRQLKAQLAQLRQENADLRRGIGITVLIDGKAVPTGSGPLPDLGATPIMAKQQPPISPTAMPAFAIAPAPMPDRVAQGGPAQNHQHNATAIPGNLFQQNAPPKPYPPAPPQNPPSREGQPGQRGAGYRDFFLD